MGANDAGAIGPGGHGVGGSRVIDLGSLKIRVLVGGEPGNGLIEMFEFTAAPGAATPPPHVHRRCTETFLVLEGVLQVCVNDDVRVARAGDVVHVPVGAVHAFTYPEPITTRLITTFAPGIGMARYFDDLRELLLAKPSGDADGLRDLMARHDTWLVG